MFSFNITASGLLLGSSSNIANISSPNYQPYLTLILLYSSPISFFSDTLIKFNHFPYNSDFDNRLAAYNKESPKLNISHFYKFISILKKTQKINNFNSNYEIKSLLP